MYSQFMAMYIRSLITATTAVAATITISTVLFIIVVALFTLWTAYQDWAAVLYNDSWIFSDEDMDYGLGWL